VKDVVGYEGGLIFDSGKPDGTPRKALDVRKLHAQGWRATTELRQGVQETYRWYLEQ
jgi:GDP-L-fucose synthase